MHRPKVLITGDFISDIHLEILQRAGLSVDYQRKHLDEKTLVELLQGARAYLLGGVELATRTVLEHCADLELIAVLGVGYNSFVDIAAATELGIAVTNTPDSNTVSVAELTVGHIINLRRNLTSLNNQAKRGTAPSMSKTWDLAGSTVGIFGMGAIGSRIAHMLYHGFGNRIIYQSRQPKPDLEAAFKARMVTKEQLLEESDVIVVMTTSAPETIGFIGEEEFSRMRDTALLINTARANLVNGHALFQALTTGSIAGAAFDGYYVEPLPPPDQDEYGLLSLPDEKFILTPHTGALTYGAAERMSNKAVQSIVSFSQSGTDQHIVNPEYRNQALRRSAWR